MEQHVTLCEGRLTRTTSWWGQMRLIVDAWSEALLPPSPTPNPCLPHRDFGHGIDGLIPDTPLDVWERSLDVLVEE